MSFLRKDVTFNIYSPNTDSPIITPQTATVAQDTVEFIDTSRFDSTDPGDDREVINADINISRSTIVYTSDDGSGTFSSGGDFNGFVITDTDDRIRAITGVEISIGGNDFSMPADNVTFTENSISVDFSGLSFSRGDKLVLLVTFREPAPGPTNIIGTDADDILSGNDRDNRIAGRAGSDILNGLGSDDILLGERGSDVLNGGLGEDFLRGGADADRFDFDDLQDSLGRRADLISDFVQGVDKIDLQAIDADSEVALNQAFTLAGFEAFSGTAGELIYGFFNKSGTSQDRTLVAADVDGDANADMIIRLKGLIELTSDDFIL